MDESERIKKIQEIESRYYDLINFWSMEVIKGRATHAVTRNSIIQFVEMCDDEIKEVENQ